MVTGEELNEQYYNDNLQWWIGSAPPYYCQNGTGGAADDLSTDSTWIGTSMTSAVSLGTPIQYTNGVKFALVNPTNLTNPTPTVEFVDGVGAPISILPLSDPSTPYSDPAQYLQSTYQIGGQKNPMFFWPLRLK